MEKWNILYILVKGCHVSPQTQSHVHIFRILELDNLFNKFKDLNVI